MQVNSPLRKEAVRGWNKHYMLAEFSDLFARQRLFHSCLSRYYFRPGSSTIAAIGDRRITFSVDVAYGIQDDGRGIPSFRRRHAARQELRQLRRFAPVDNRTRRPLPIEPRAEHLAPTRPPWRKSSSTSSRPSGAVSTASLARRPSRSTTAASRSCACWARCVGPPLTPNPDLTS